MDLRLLPGCEQVGDGAAGSCSAVVVRRPLEQRYWPGPVAAGRARVLAPFPIFYYFRLKYLRSTMQSVSRCAPRAGTGGAPHGPFRSTTLPTTACSACAAP